MVYTSVENIHKVIDPLFLAELTRRVNEITALPPSSSTQKKLKELQAEIASLSFLDPASGSGNFLTETFICLRRLENKIISALQQGQGELDLGLTVKVSISQFHGIEINDFAVSVAKTALWIAEAQMLRATAEILHREPDYLPLKDYDGIIEGNALRMDWGGLLNVANVQMLPIAKFNSQLGNREPGTENWKLGNGTGNTTTLATFSYIMGNPPFVGYSNQSAEQKADMLSIFVDEKGKPSKTAGKLDYVCAWYRKAADYILGTTEYTENTEKKSSVYSVSSVVKNPSTKCAFVSTNSICQGESVAAMWKPLFEMGLEIDFAWRTFRWDNEAQAKAHVHCVIVGFGVRGDFNRVDRVERVDGNGIEIPQMCTNLHKTISGDECGFDKKLTQSGEKETSRTSRTSRELKKIYDGDKVIEVEHINGYLMDGPDVWVESRTKPICDVPVMVYGNKPTDGGYLFLTKEEKDEVLEREPEISRFIKQIYGATEYINNTKRYCLWLVGASPAEIRKSKFILERIENVRRFRLNSTKAQTRESAETPTLFQEIRQPNSNYIIIPRHSSENRNYIPFGFVSSEIIVNDAVQILPSATLYHFGVLTSSVHMAWMRTVCGRLEMRYRYSANIVYNNFPWPDVGEFSRVEGESVENVLDRINKIDKIGDDENPDNPVNPVKKTLHVSTRSTRLNNSVCSVSSVVKNITQTAQSILDARALYPDSSLADLYDPLTMPIELRKAHAANDAAVMKAYGYSPSMTEPEIVADLMTRYQKLTMTNS
jgi:hypothetical protein